MAVDWADFVLFLAVVKELYDAIYYFKERGKKHEEVRAAAEKYRREYRREYYREYRRCYTYPDFAKLMADGRTRLKLSELFF